MHMQMYVSLYLVDVETETSNRVNVIIKLSRLVLRNGREIFLLVMEELTRMSTEASSVSQVDTGLIGFFEGMHLLLVSLLDLERRMLDGRWSLLT